MNRLFVGDVQNNLGVIDAALARPEHVVFLGDVLDSWESGPLEHIAALDTILNAVEAGKATLLWANHEWSYLHKRLKCSGWNMGTALAMRQRAEKYLALSAPYYYDEQHRVLATHAGITKHWWEQEKLDFKTLPLTLNRVSRSHGHSWFFAIGSCRGGSEGIGGPLWCDWDHEFEPVEGLRQIVGHTPHEDFQWSPNGDVDIDCLRDQDKVLLWVPDENKFEEVKL